MPVRETLLVEYTEHALLQHVGIMREAYDLASREGFQHYISWDLKVYAVVA